MHGTYNIIWETYVQIEQGKHNYFTPTHNVCITPGTDPEIIQGGLLD